MSFWYISKSELCFHLDVQPFHSCCKSVSAPTGHLLLLLIPAIQQDQSIVPTTIIVISLACFAVFYFGIFIMSSYCVHACLCPCHGVRTVEVVVLLSIRGSGKSINFSIGNQEKTQSGTMNSMAALRIVLQWLSTKTQNATKSKKTRAYRQQATRLLATSSTMIMQTLETREVLS